MLIDAPVVGNYTINIGHTGSSFTQNYSLLIGGATSASSSTNIIGTAGNDRKSWVLCNKLSPKC
ncbi:hypothetical protein [Aerosakkonema funiforme]|uniref:hypothetical protein n=1 Tax=Aerosakkonema funiforme TaxID=1246630 RepID=UPI0035BC091C